jgi:hypothetical protein|nr:MAG TPA: hypothetical protein [Caudoviricetes sp.]
MKKLPFIFLLPLLSTVSVAEQLNYKSFRPHIPTPYEVGYEMEQGRIQARIEYENRKKEEEEYLNVLIKKAFLKQDIEDALTYARKNLSQIGYEYVKNTVKKERRSGELSKEDIAKRIWFYANLEKELEKEALPKIKKELEISKQVLPKIYYQVLVGHIKTMRENREIERYHNIPEEISKYRNRLVQEIEQKLTKNN